MSLDEKITRMHYLRNDFRRLDAETKALKDEFKRLEDEVIQELVDTGMTRAGNAVATVSLSEEDLPSVDPEQWDELQEYLMENGYTECIPRRLNSAPVRALWQMGIELPGVSRYTKRKLSLTKVNR